MLTPSPSRWLPSPPVRGLALGLGMMTLSVASPSPASGAQGAVEEQGWNSERVIALVERAREARASLVEDESLQSYRALTQGHIYFFVDPEVGERALIRVDQVAVELRWQAPDLVQQHILGERSEKRLPVPDFQYYLDRLTLVQYGLGDEIRVGSGRDVAGVPHPFAPLSASGALPYQYRLADSLSVVLPGRAEPLRLYEIDVRPEDPEAPGILGSVTVDEASAEIVRMAFTFTQASYVDPRTDRISVELDYGLWEERYWLPNLQHIEVRREIPELDIGVGTVIRAILRTSDYRLNAPLPEDLALLPAVSTEPEDARQEYAFDTGLFDALARDGMSDVNVAADPRELRAKAMELVRGQALSGLSPLRLQLAGLSSLARYSRAEGFAIGVGATFQPGDRVTLTSRLGYRIGAGHAHGSVNLEIPVRPSATVQVAARWRHLDDVGFAPGSDPLLSSMGSLFLGEDYRDPFHVSGVGAGVVVTGGTGFRLALHLGWDRMESAELHVTDAALDSDRAFRPVREVAEGDFLRATIDASHPVSSPFGGRGAVEMGAGLLFGAPGTGGWFTIAHESVWGPPSGERELLYRGRAWSWMGDPLPQGHRLVGGRGTLPGYPFRVFVGRTAAVATLEASTDLGTPLVRLRAAFHVGSAGRADEETAALWDAEASGGTRTSASIGTGLLWDIVRLDLARGLNGGEWQTILSVDPRWWGHL